MIEKFLYILGGVSDNEFIINFVFFEDFDLLVLIDVTCLEKNSILQKTDIISGKKYTSVRKIFPKNVKKIKIGEDVLNFDFTKPWKFNFLNCDCQFVPECDLKYRVVNDLNTINFHLGDQIYLDLLFMESIENEYPKDIIREKIYLEYKKAFSRKTDILQKSFNIMLGDDHEIADESLATNSNPFIKKVFKDIFYEIQYALRFSESNLISFDDKTFVLVDNIDTLSPREYLANVSSIFTKITNQDNIYILSTRNMLNTQNNPVYNEIFSDEDNSLNYSQFYNMLFDRNKKITILCGDEHSCAKYELSKGDKKIDLYFVGPLNSVPEPFKNKFLLNDEKINIKEIYYYQKHSYMFLTDKGLNQEIQNDSCCFNSYSTISYTMKYLRYKILFKKE